MRFLMLKAYTTFSSLFIASVSTYYAIKKREDEKASDVRTQPQTMSASSGSEESPTARSNVACSFEKSVQAADSTLKQLSTAKETFRDFEAFYKKFVVELNSVKEEHRHEVRRMLFIL